ncbi:MAG: NAD(P)/FAD-dependent oxidoreductase [Bacillota bacterium]|nr:NAD(P)/FAD-dependent oxidoreductase [Bacillota bacterium]
MAEVIVVGGGPAGISAAIYLQRFKRDVLVLMKDQGALGKADSIENYYGIVEAVSGAELIARGVAQAERLGVKVRKEEVLAIETGDGFSVKTATGVYTAKAVLLATGMSRTNLKVRRYNDFVGRGISFCAVCDGFLYRQKKIGIVGNGEFMLEELDVLRNFSQDLTIFTNGEPLVHNPENVRIVTDPLVEILGTDRLSGVATATSQVPLDVLFVAIGTASASDFALRIGALMDNNKIVVDHDFMTNIEGLFAAGDCIGGLAQVAKAVSDGAQAGITMHKHLKSIKS